MRSHQIAGDRKWRTFTDGPEATYVLVPIEDIGGMSAEEIGNTVKSLLIQARITRVCNWLDSPSGHLQPTCGASSNPNNKFVNFCVMLGRDSELEGEIFKEIEQLKDVDDDLRIAFNDICKTMDETLHYLRTKRGKLSPGQLRAKKFILEMRRAGL